MTDSEIQDYVSDQLQPIYAAIFLIAWSVGSMAKVNSNGHVAADNSPQPIVGTSGTAYTVGAGTYGAVYEFSAGVFKPTDGTEAAANVAAGVVLPGTYTVMGPMTVYPPGSELPPLAGPILGEVYASKTGTLVTTISAAVDLAPAATSWSYKAGKSLAEVFIVEDVVVEQRTN